MISPRIFLPLVLLAATCLAEQQDLSPADAVKILGEITAIEQRQKQSELASINEQIAKIESASRSGGAAIAFYQDAIRATKYSGKSGGGYDYADWLKKQDKVLHDRGMQTCVQLHLKYLALTLRAAAGVQRKDLQQPVNDYIKDLMEVEKLLYRKDDNKKEDSKKATPNTPANAAAFAGWLDLSPQIGELLNKPVNTAVFSEWLGLGPLLGRPKNWEMAPGNLTGILDKNLRPFLREQKSRELIVSWDFQISHDEAASRASNLNHEADKFDSITKPGLRWSRAEDLIVLDQSGQGLQEMIVLIRTYPQHPDFAKWLARVRDIVTPKAAEAKSATTPAAAPAPEAAAQ